MALTMAILIRGNLPYPNSQAPSNSSWPSTTPMAHAQAKSLTPTLVLLLLYKHARPPDGDQNLASVAVVALVEWWLVARQGLANRVSCHVATPQLGGCARGAAGAGGAAGRVGGRWRPGPAHR